MGLNDFDNLDFEDATSDETISTSGGSNRTFLIVAGILGGILLIALLAIAAYAVLLPGREISEQTQVAEVIATNTAIAEHAQQTAIARQITLTPISSATLEPTETPEVSDTPTLTPSSTSTPILAPTNTPEPTPGEGTPDPAASATVAALLTQQAGGDGAVIPTATALPNTGFADDVGVPGLLLLTGVLMVVIILSRRLRTITN
jgi:type II secretory pathway pseudopilin PulG